jgi:hypothetical protein
MAGRARAAEPRHAAAKRQAVRGIVSLLIAAAALPVCAAPVAAGRPPGLRVVLRPAVVRLGQRATIAVSDPSARRLEVRLAGATNSAGTTLPWRPLRLVDGTWLGTLPAPALRGIYPLELRTQPEAASLYVFRFLRVFAPGTQTRPSFEHPTSVARWWVLTIPHAKLVALKAWPRPAFDQRDVRLHRLFVVAYSPPGRPRVRDRLGMFITAYRDGYRGRWRLLEATVQP